MVVRHRKVFLGLNDSQGSGVLGRLQHLESRHGLIRVLIAKICRRVVHLVLAIAVGVEYGCLSGDEIVH